MKKALLFLLPISFLFYGCSTDGTSKWFEFKTQTFQLSLDDQGAIQELVDITSGTNYLAEDTLSYLLSIRMDSQIVFPHLAEAEADQIILHFQPNITANIKVEEKNTHLTFELVDLSPKEAVELVVWGPYATTIDQVIGETVGVVRGEAYALGIQSLNIKTLGGYPWNESDRMPAFDIFRSENWANMHPDTDGSVLYRVEAAKPTNSGSSLQTYCRNRSQPRIIKDFQHQKIMAPAYEDGGVIGSKIALFGCLVDQALSTLGKLEVAEGLPHPMIDNQWGKEAVSAPAAYIISDFTESNVDDAIALTKKAGLRYLYHYGKTFENWGHFELYKGEFPDGRESLKRCVEKAAAQDVMLGTHVLSNFITTNDPYVTPVPDDRLAIVGESALTEAIDAITREIPIESPDFFNQMKNNSLKTVRVGDELIRYGQVSETVPWTLLDCQRGAFGTKAASHQQGDTIRKLLDHAYKVFLTNADLTIEMSETMADLYNQTGLRQISFDGLEGNRSTGLGTYGESLMPYTWYNNLNDDLKRHLIIDASRTTHFFWHIYSRMNWGEPWYGGFRESQTEYRFNNQKYFQRNFMPGMLGWFKMTPETSIEDIEWLLAKSAGYNAGYAFVASLDVVHQNGNADPIFELIGDWEKLRIGGAFTEVQKEQMRDTDQEFSLRKTGANQWSLSNVKAVIVKHENLEKQPGEPRQSTIEFENIGAEQAIHFILTAKGSDVRAIELEMDHYKPISLPVPLKTGHILKYNGGEQAMIYNANWELQNTIDLNPEDFTVKPGSHTLTFGCQFQGSDEKASVKVEVRTLGKEEKIDFE